MDPEESIIDTSTLETGCTGVASGLKSASYSGTVSPSFPLDTAGVRDISS